jgi:hypothetical protein
MKNQTEIIIRFDNERPNLPRWLDSNHEAVIEHGFLEALGYKPDINKRYILRLTNHSDGKFITIKDSNIRYMNIIKSDFKTHDIYQRQKHGMYWRLQELLDEISMSRSTRIPFCFNIELIPLQEESI